jgi:hypothetical protein
MLLLLPQLKMLKLLKQLLQLKRQLLLKLLNQLKKLQQRGPNQMLRRKKQRQRRLLMIMLKIWNLLLPHGLVMAPHLQLLLETLLSWLLQDQDLTHHWIQMAELLKVHILSKQQPLKPPLKQNQPKKLKLWYKRKNQLPNKSLLLKQPSQLLNRNNQNKNMLKRLLKKLRQKLLKLKQKMPKIWNQEVLLGPDMELHHQSV